MRSRRWPIPPSPSPSLHLHEFLSKVLSPLSQHPYNSLLKRFSYELLISRLLLFFWIKGHVYPNPARRSLCLSSGETASVSLARMWWKTWPKAFQRTPRGNKADVTAWWHLLLCIVSFYQSSVFHLCETRHSDAKCQACWPSSVEREVLRVKSELMKPSCPSPADSPGTPNGSGKASLLQCVSANVKTNVTWYPSMLFVVAITAVDNAWCFVSAFSFSVAFTKQDLLAGEPLQPGRCTCPTLPVALCCFFTLSYSFSLNLRLGMQTQVRTVRKTSLLSLLFRCTNRKFWLLLHLNLFLLLKKNKKKKQTSEHLMNCVIRLPNNG